MKREPLPFYPLIVATFPVVSIYSTNLAYVPAKELVRPLLVVLLGSAILTLLASLALRSAARGAAATATFAVCFFAYSWFVGLTSLRLSVNGLPGNAAWYAVTALLVGLAAWRVRRVGPLNVLASFIVLVAILNIGLSLARSSRFATRSQRVAINSGVAATRPDVFYIILDGHGRRDSILRTIGYDDESFLKGLRDRGFYVADRSHANYCQTELSLSSSLNMDFIPRLLPKVDAKTDDRAPLGRLIDDNEVARRFRARGYRFLAVTSGFPPVSFSSADAQLGTRWGGTMVETSLLQMTPLGTTDDAIGSQYVARRKNLLGAFENLDSLGAPTPSPRFVVIHILAPHPPFIFEADGTPRPRKGQFCYCDGSDYLTYVGPELQYRSGYASQVAWVENRTLLAIDRLLAGEGSGRRPIIIVQGDHGSKLRLDQNSLAKTDLHECYPNLNAYLVPDALRKDLRPDITPVNSFRVVLHDLFGDDLPPLPDRSWYSTFPLPYDFTEVTDRIEPVTGRADVPPR